MDLPYYPINDFGPLMKGIVIGGLGIVHVFVAQFAIGGGMLLCYFQYLAQTNRCPYARRFLDSSMPLERGSHADAKTYGLVDLQLRVSLADGTTVGLANADQLRGYCGATAAPSAIL